MDLTNNTLATLLSTLSSELVACRVNFSWCSNT